MPSPADDLSTFTYLLANAVDVNFRDGSPADAEAVYPGFTKKGDTTDGYSYISTSTVGLGPWGKTGEVESYHHDKHQPGRKRISYWVKWSNGFIVTQDLQFKMSKSTRVLDDQMKILDEKQTQLKNGYTWVKDLVALYFQTRARTSTNDGVWMGTGSDGLTLASLVHMTIRSPQVAVNNAQATQPLTQSAMIETVGMLRNQKGDDNRPGVMPKSVTWQIGFWNQRKIISPLYSEKQPGTANNDPNVLTNPGRSEYRVKYDYIVNQYLDDADTSWLAFTPDHKMYFFEPSEQILYGTEKDTNTGALVSTGWNWFGIDWHSFRNVVQCAGA